jgi:hypothetical protein
MSDFLWIFSGLVVLYIVYDLYRILIVKENRDGDFLISLSARLSGLVVFPLMIFFDFGFLFSLFLLFLLMLLFYCFFRLCKYMGF